MNEKLSIAFAAIAALLGLSVVALGWQGTLFLIFEDGLNLQRTAFAGIPTIIFVIYFFSVRRWLSQRRYDLACAAAFTVTALSIGAYFYLYGLAI